MAKRLARHLVNDATRLIGWSKRKQRIRLPVNGPVKVNLGCGLQVASGWLNIDGSLNALVSATPQWMQSIAYKLSGARQFYSQDYYRDTLSNNFFCHHNLLYGIPLEDQTVDFVYSSHFLEHLTKEHGRRLLDECFRVLKPGGVLRIAVPDLEHAWQMYRRGDKERMIHDFFFSGDETGFGQHRYAYDYELLSAVLYEKGFTQIQRAEFQKGATPDLPFLDNREDYTLFVEARRPVRSYSTGEISF